MKETENNPMFRRAVLLLLLIIPTNLISISADEPVRLRVLSYNIHHGEGIDGQLNLDRIAKIIRDVDPDLVGLQEVDRNCARSQNVDQPAELARLTGLHAAFEKNINLQTGEYGNAVLSRWPIQSHKNHHMPCLENGEQRGALFVDVKIPVLTKSDEFLPLTFVSTHFDHRRPDAERLASADMVNKLALQNGSDKMILAGDLNAGPDSAVLEKILKQWTNTAKTPMPTIPVTTPQTQIDFILYSAGLQAKTIECQVLAEAVASDHRAIFSVIEVQP